MAEGNMNEIFSKLVEQNQILMAALQSSMQTASKHESSVQTKPRVVSNIQFEKYDDISENFDSFIERFSAFMDIQSVPEEQKGKVLISSLSPKLFSLLKSLIAPIAPADKSYEEITEVLKKHLNPKPLIIPSRHAFLNRKQHEGESISTFIAELRTLAVPCCYSESMLNTMLRDVFVSGLSNKAMLDRLFEEDDSDLEKTLNIALAMEKAAIGARNIMGNDKQLGIKVFKANKKQNSSKVNKSLDKTDGKVTKKSCMRCGKDNHASNLCKHKSTICNYCKVKGHLYSVCFKAQKDKRNKNFKQLNQMKHEEMFESDIDETVPLHGVNVIEDVTRKECEPKGRSPILLSVKIDNKVAKMELDTGAAVSTMSHENFRKLSSKKLIPTNLTFKTYKGDTIIPMGYANVEAEYYGQKHFVKLYIIKESVDTLFGREWLFKFKINWASIKSVKAEESSLTRKSSLSKLLEEYQELFADELGEIKNFECKLDLKPNATPVFVKPRMIPFALKKRVEDEIDSLESQGIIERTDFSEWATPVVPVVKPDGSIRLCADFSVTLNPNLKIPQHPLPKLEEIFSCLSGGKHFSKIDFSKAYLQMKVHPDTQKLLTINTHKGLFTCKRLMYGINAAPAIWQKFVETIFQDLEGVKVFMDDARLTGPDDETHLNRIRKFFERCKEYGLRINLKKSKFFQDEIDFLGHRINAQGLKKTDEKVRAVLKAETPKNVQDVKSFLGLVQFYGRFFQDLATWAYPLNNLTKKDVPWNWTKECQEAFDKIKREICSDKILIHYDPKLPLVLATDASPVGIGAVLSHRLLDGTERPISFSSRTLSKTEQHYSQIDKEALSISWAVKKFYLYLKGRRFILITDHKPLVSIFGSKKGLPVLAATRLLHYALQLQAFEFDIQYRHTKDHGNADYLSRLPLKSEELEVKDDIGVFQLSQIETLPVTSKDLAKETEKDEELALLVQTLKSGGRLKGREAEYELYDGCILYGQRVCIPRCFQSQVLQELHHGHLGVVKMKAIARSHVYWKNMDRDIEEIAKNCVNCSKHKINPPKVKVHFWEYPSQPWERIHIDFAGPIFGHMFLLIVDAYSKWLEVYPLKSITSSVTIDCLRDCFSRYGIPVTLVSDNGPQLASEEFETFLSLNGVKHKTCAPFNPSSNGQAERYVFTLKQSLRTMSDYPGNIQRKLQIFLMQYRKAPNQTSGHSPAMLFLKREIRTRIDLLCPNLKNRIEEKLRKNNIVFKDRTFDIGDKVAVRNYKSANAKWTFGTIVNKDGQLHYTVNVNGILTRRHVDQLRGSGDFKNEEEYSYIPRIQVRSKPNSETPSTGHVMAENLPEKTEKLSEPVANQVVPPKSPESTLRTGNSTKEATDTQNIVRPTTEMGTPSAEIVRCSTRIRKPPNRLNL